MLGRKHRSIRSWLALTAVSATAASGLAVLSAGGAAATITEAITVVPSSGTAITVQEGDSTGPTLVGKFTDSDNFGANTNCSPTLYSATIHWGDNTSNLGTVVCEHAGTTTALIPTGVFDVGGTHVYKDSGNYVISVSVTDTQESETSATVNTDTASVTDADLEFDWANAPDGPYVQVEGGSVTVQAAFFDNNRWYPEIEGLPFDPGITAKINWGDGSAAQSVTPSNPPDACDCFGDIGVSASHVYDAPKAVGARYTITVTVTDDGGATASATLSAEISDAALTAGAAKSFVAPAAQAASHVVASFTDAAGAQAAAADFTASIKWGDSTTSAGTVTKTADGKFDVSGTHTYSTAGSKTLSITVTDEEGQTLTMTATATVPALPTTGQPQTPVPPSTPLAALLALVLGLAIAVGSSGIIVARRI